MSSFWKVVPFILFSLPFCGKVSAQSVELKGGKFVYPVQAEKGISGDFGEMRPNHFHSGVDFTTEAVEGKKVMATQKGWISRLNVSTSGYGKALYVTHPDGHTSVYGHLSRFSKKLDSIVLEEQYKRKSYHIEVYFPPESIAVEEGEVIAYSGNTGASGGPHLHFEIRNTETQVAVNPMSYFPALFHDDIPPIIHRILVAPVGREGVVNMGTNYACYAMDYKTHSIKESITAWGKIQLAVDAIDRMNGNSHVFAVPIVKLYVDGKLISSIDIDNIDLRITRHYNGIAYYPEFIRTRRLYLSSYKKPNCQMDIYKNLDDNNGAILINEERPYSIRYELEDGKGNRSTLKFVIMGKKQEIKNEMGEEEQWLDCHKEHLLRIEDFEVSIPAGCLFEDMIFKGYVKNNYEDGALFPHYYIGDGEVPLAKPMELIFTIPHGIKMPQNKVYIASISKEGKKSYVSNRQRGRKVYGKVRNFGIYTLCVDTMAPTIKEVSLSSSNVSFHFADEGTGVKSFEASLDGEFLLLVPNASNTRANGKVPYNRFGRPKERILRIEAKDFCDNVSFYEKKVVF